MMAQIINNVSEPNIAAPVKNDGVLSPLLVEYEAVIRTLEAQIELFKKEHDNLRLDLASVVSENKTLSVQLKAALNSKCATSPRHRKESDMVTNLQRQLALTVQEKESTVQMWQLALQEVDSLEEELRSYQNNKQVEIVQRQLEEVKHEYSTAITMLEEKLTDVRAVATKEKTLREQLEHELARAVQEKETLTRSLEERTNLLEQAVKDHGAVLERLQHCEKHEASLTEELQEVKESCKQLEAALEKCQLQIQGLMKKEKIAMDKVQEALSIVDSALLEKDMALLAESKAAEEIKRLNKVIAELIEDAGVKVKEEVEQVKKQFNGQIQILLNDIKNLQVEVSSKTSQLEKVRRDSKVLEEELNRVTRESRSKEIPDTSLLQKNLENVYNELSKVENSNFELSNEKDRLVAQIHQLEERHTMELKQRLMEKQLLEEQLNAVNAQLNKCSQSEIAAITQAELLAKQVESLEQELHSRGVSGKYDWWNYEQRMQEHQQLIEQLHQVQKRGVQMAQELQEHLKSQVDIKNKWQNEVKTLTKKFEDRIENLQAQLSKLKKTNRALENELNTTRMELEHHVRHCKLKF